MDKLLKLIENYQQLGISEIIDHEKFNHIAIVHHSTRIEGSTLTAIETQVLLDKGLTPKGKAMSDSCMVTDHYAALQFVLKSAKEKREISIQFIQEINALLVKNTGKIYNTIFGTIDSCTGAFRKGNVCAGSTYFPNYDKVISLTEGLVREVGIKIKSKLSIIEQLNLSFDIHFNLVSIHPFYDGNGRTSRLLMNFIQAYYQLPLTLVFEESKVEYIEALIASREENDIQIFREFMHQQMTKFLEIEIHKFEEMEKPRPGKGFSLMF